MLAKQGKLGGGDHAERICSAVYMRRYYPQRTAIERNVMPLMTDTRQIGA